MTGHSKGIDGDVALTDELDRLSEISMVAKFAPRGPGLSRYLSQGFRSEEQSGQHDGPYWRLTRHLLQRLSIWWSIEGYVALPTMTPWCIRDRSARYDQGPESWGAPRADGYFRDDNSIIKKLPLGLRVESPDNTDYNGRKPWRGFTACHIWRELEGGTIGGVDPWIYSFMPNLVWLPRPLAGLTDYHTRVQDLLKRTSFEIYADVTVKGPLAHAEYAWGLLTPTALATGETLDTSSLASFSVDPAFVRRRVAYLDKIIAGLDRLLAREPLQTKIICSRYTDGLPTLNHQALREFRSAMSEYRDSVRASED